MNELANRIWELKNGVRVRLLLASICSIGSLAFVYFCPKDLSEVIIRKSGYYFTLVVAICAVVALFRAARKIEPLRWREVPWQLLMLIATAGAWLLFIQVDLGFKIAMDDYVLASTASNLHESREVAASAYPEEMAEAYGIEATFVDKRPWLYPFIISSVHDIFGYRVENSFFVNAMLGCLFLAGASLLGWYLSGVFGALLSVLLWLSLPLLAQNASGGGLELLNLFLLQACVFLSVLYLSRPTAANESLLCLSAVLLAYARYESGGFLLPILMIVILGWFRRRRCICSWGLVVAPVLLCALMLHIKIYLSTESSWELAAGASDAFELRYVVENMPHALAFFFSGDASLANSILLSAVGGVSLIAICVIGRRCLRSGLASSPAALAIAIFTPFFLLQLLLMLGFHAGRLDSPFVSRYALPFHLILVIATVVVLGSIRNRWPGFERLSIISVLCFVIGFSLPANAKAIFSKRNFAVNEQCWLEDLSDNLLLADSLIIDRFTLNWALRGWAVLPPYLALNWLDEIKLDSSTGRYRAIYVVERSLVDDGVFVPIQIDESRLSEYFDYELVAECSFRPFTLTRVFRVEGTESLALSQSTLGSTISFSINEVAVKSVGGAGIK